MRSLAEPPVTTIVLQAALKIEGHRAQPLAGQFQECSPGVCRISGSFDEIFALQRIDPAKRGRQWDFSGEACSRDGNAAPLLFSSKELEKNVPGGIGEKRRLEEFGTC